jgi:hypothetical protein
MGRARNANEGEEECIQYIGGKARMEEITIKAKT